jgi:YesN/AraC family two-component response regulator
MINYATLYNETKDLTVLFVDDYEPLRLEMEAFLVDLFKKVSIASNGKEAIELYEASEEGFDLIITDIQMPVMDGVGLSAEICKMNDHQPIVVLSAHSDSEYLVKLINIGVSKFLSKPIDHNELFAILYDESKKINREKEKSPVENPMFRRIRSS